MTRSTRLNKNQKLIIKILAVIVALLLPVLYYNLKYSGKIYPNIVVSGIEVGGLKPHEAETVLSNTVVIPDKLNLVSSEKSIEISSKDIDARYDFADTSLRAFAIGRSGNILSDFLVRINLINSVKEIGIATNLNEDKIDRIMSAIAAQVSDDVVYPNIDYVNGKININPGSPGKELDTQSLRAQIGQAFAYTKRTPIVIPLKIVDPSLSSKEVDLLKKRSEKLISKQISAVFENSTYKIIDSDLIGFLGIIEGYNDEKINKSIDNLAKQIERTAQEPKFIFNDGRVTEFLPALDGIKIDRAALKALLTESLKKLENTEAVADEVVIPAQLTPPAITTEKVNNLGIRELIGVGTSKYRGSIPSRLHNIEVASSKLNGLLIKPGETFSFNNALGDVSKFTGYQEAYVIRDGKTILGDGGGVCQVSTTLFRAALKAGLPIQERQAHAYRVGYYEQDSSPGLDATVYGPSPDLKIVNDTPAYILIQAKADIKNYSLTFELYGTSDGRTATTTKPVVSSVIAPPEDLYKDDPSLPLGTTKQVEHKAWGAKVSFNYTVIRNGENIYKKTFVSNYRPWQAVYLRGTGPVN